MMPYIFTIVIAGAIFTAFLIMFTKGGHGENGRMSVGACLIISGIIFLATTVTAIFRYSGLG